MIARYIFCFIVLLLVVFTYCHISNLRTINNHLDIIQVCDPDLEIILEMFNNHKPIIFQKELFYWKEFKNFINKDLSNIKNTIATNTQTNYSTIIKTNLEPLNLPLSYDWTIDIRNIILDDKSGIFFIQQSNYLQCFGCVTGQFRIIIAPPDQVKHLESLINNVSTLDATTLLEQNPTKLNFIEVIIREGNMIYIPWNWFYFIYRPDMSKETVIIDCINKSILCF
jgi:hypothetical protein